MSLPEPEPGLSRPGVRASGREKAAVSPIDTLRLADCCRPPVILSRRSALQQTEPLSADSPQSSRQSRPTVGGRKPTARSRQSTVRSRQPTVRSRKLLTGTSPSVSSSVQGRTSYTIHIGTTKYARGHSHGDNRGGAQGRSGDTKRRQRQPRTSRDSQGRPGTLRNSQICSRTHRESWGHIGTHKVGGPAGQERAFPTIPTQSLSYSSIMQNPGLRYSDGVCRVPFDFRPNSGHCEHLNLLNLLN